MDKRLAGFAVTVIFIAVMLGAIAAMDSGLGRHTPALKPAPGPDGLWADYTSLSVAPSDRLDNPVFGVSSGGKDYMYDMNDSGVKFCAPDTDYTCTTSAALRFAVPRHELKMGDKWRFMGASFEVVPLQQDSMPLPPRPAGYPAQAGEQSVEMLGEDVLLYSILVHNNDSRVPCIDVYLYSRQRGVIGDMHQCEDRLATFSFLREMYGPGSKDFDSKVPASALLGAKELADLTR